MGSQQQIALQWMEIGLAHHRAGRVEQAEQIYRNILQIEPDNPYALHLLGVIAHQVKKQQLALELIDKSLGLKPDLAEAWANRGLTLQELGRYEEALISYDRALAIRPDYAEALNNRGNVLSALERYAEALASYERALAFAPDYGEALSNRGNALKKLARYQEALDSYQRALTIRPGNAETAYNRGVALQELERYEEAVASYDQALTSKPNFPEALSNRGNALQELKRYEEALASYDQALAVRPDYAEALNNRGNALTELKRYDEALACFDRALALKADYAEALCNRGNTFRALGRYEEALLSYERALAIDPRHADTAYVRGVALQELKRYEEAEASYSRTLAARPDYTEAYLQRAHARQYLCDWSETDREVQVLRRHVAASTSGKVSPFTFLTLPGTTGDEQFACARQFAMATQSAYLSRPPLHGKDSRPAGRKLRIGYLSADYFEHPTSYLVAEVVERHDRARFEIIGYSYGRDDQSPMRKRMQAAFDEFHDIRELPAESAARHIAGEQIDILVDLKGYTAHSRPQITAMRPAPVQVNWLGYPGTLGVPRLADYLIGDPVVTPLEHAGRYSEALALMPHCYQPNDRQRAIGARPSRAGAGLPLDGFVFCCFNQSYKITPETFDLWCRLLWATRGSFLWLLRPSPAAQDNLRREAQARGLAPERLVFTARLPLSEHLGRLQLADLALDTYPYTSHTTASDALWVGVPLVTRIGTTFASRVAASILRAAGVPELVAESADSAYGLALGLATRPERLKALRAKLAANRLTCPLFDSGLFTRDLESLYNQMWSNHLAGSAKPIVLAAAEQVSAFDAR